MEHNPLSALVGGLAVGVAIGALLPKTQAEAKHLGPVGRRITEGAAAAARAAREQGRQEIEALIPDKGAAKDRVSSLVGAVAQAARDGAKDGAKTA
ncbi:hypothetical protein FBR43_03590 [Sphingomonas baiyangensis]|uniref:YtxH domain-containing protein n=1 Tax=Sphingomonas baiyangensis TaxID=2572576 RepID=A0A4U1L6Z0_9SPHN|nr:hypothetical protein FBR43_03590 [Sphingomonas baiyangensis]